MIIITKVLGKISLICWSGVFFMVLNAYFQHTLTRLAPILAYNHIQGFFGWTFFIALGSLLLWALLKGMTFQSK